MKYLIILLLLVGCSKINVTPNPQSVKDLVGHYTGTSANNQNAGASVVIAVDVVIAKSGSAYSATGTYTVNSVITTITQSSVGDATPGWFMYFNSNAFKLFNIGASGDYNTLTINGVGTPNTVGLNAFTLTRNQK